MRRISKVFTHLDRQDEVRAVIYEMGLWDREMLKGLFKKFFCFIWYKSLPCVPKKL